MNQYPNGTPGASALRKGRVSICNHYFHVTFTTAGRKKIFDSFVVARTMIKTIHRMRHASTVCYTVMPDHVHWLFQLVQDSNLSRCVQTLKSFSARNINRELKTHGRIWQAGFFDHAIRDEKHLRSVARYIVANPLRAGLVDNVAHYPHWDAIWL